jgi:hypothetical protein
MFDMGGRDIFLYFTLNKVIKCVSYSLSMPRLNFLSVVFGQCKIPGQGSHLLQFAGKLLNVVGDLSM